MRTDNPLDHIKDFYQKESMAFDQDKTWEEIEARLEKKKERYPIFWLLFGLGLMMAVGSFIFIQSNVHQADALVTERNKVIADNQNQTVSSIKEASAQLNESEGSQDKSEKQFIDQNTTEQNPSDHLENTKISDEKNRAKTSNQSVGIPSNIGVKGNKNPANISGFKKQERLVAQNNSQPQKATKNQSEYNKLFSEHKNSATASALDEAFEASEHIDFLELQALKNAAIELKGITLQDRKALCKIPKPWHIMLEGYGGANMPLINTVLKKENETDRVYLNKWNDIQKSNPGYQFGGALILSSPSGFEFSLGVERQLFSENLSSTKRVIETIKTYDPMAYFYFDDMNNKIWVGDTIITTKIVDKKEELTQRHRLWNIPIKVGFLKQHKKWNTGGHIGAAIHMDHVFQGRILQQNGSYIDVTAENQNILYKKNVGVSLVSDVHLGKQLNDHLEIFLRPEFRYRMDPWSTDKTVLDIFIQDFKINTGIRYLIR